MKLETQLTTTELLNLYQKMLLIREFEEKAAQMYTQGKISGFTHLYIGQEAVAVGAISAILDHDYVITAYREHGQALAKGCDPKEIMAELFGKATGVSGGRGGSMHLCDIEHRFMGGFAIVAGQLPLAVGLGLSITYKKENDVVLCLFGDGAVNEGAFHESLNLAKLWDLPVIFLCENNQYAMGTAVSRATSLTNIAQHACSYEIPSHRVNGMDVLAVRETVEHAVRYARAGHGPSLIEALTYRYRGHSMADPLKYRAAQEEEIWQERDPIPNLAQKLIEQNITTQQAMDQIQQEVTQILESAVAFAEESPEPPLDSLMTRIYEPFSNQNPAPPPKKSLLNPQ